MTWEDTEGMPHIVICKNEKELKCIEFTGSEARENAHAEAMKLTDSFDGCIMVAVRVRQLCSYKRRELMAP